MSLEFECKQILSKNAPLEVICNKHNIILAKMSKKNEYVLKFNISNKNINIRRFTDWNIFDLLFTLNRDILEDMVVSVINNGTRTYSYLFKRFGKELGISQRFMSFDLNLVKEKDSVINYISNSSKKNNIIFSKSESVISNFTNFEINIINDNSMDITYYYHIDLDEQMPKSMENIAGVLIKKLFWRYKTFIENLY